VASCAAGHIINHILYIFSWKFKWIVSI